MGWWGDYIGATRDFSRFLTSFCGGTISPLGLQVMNTYASGRTLYPSSP